MAFIKNHKTYEITLKPLVNDSELKVQYEDEGWHYSNDLLVVPPKKFIKIFLDQWEIIRTENDTENLAKLKELGYKEGAACRILDALGLD